MRTSAPVNFLPPSASGLCGQAWSYFAAQAVNGKPVVSKHLPAIVAETGFNLGNLKCELSRFNRYHAALSAGTLVAPPVRGARPAVRPVVQLGAVVAPATPQALAALFFAHPANIDAAHREIAQREAEGEDMSDATVDTQTTAIIKPTAKKGKGRKAH